MAWLDGFDQNQDSSNLRITLMVFFIISVLIVGAVIAMLLVIAPPSAVSGSSSSSMMANPNQNLEAMQDDEIKQKSDSIIFEPANPFEGTKGNSLFVEESENGNGTSENVDKNLENLTFDVVIPATEDDEIDAEY